MKKNLTNDYSLHRKRRCNMKAGMVAFLILCIGIFGFGTVYAQQGSHKIQGKVVAAEDDEPIIGAVILEIGNDLNGTVSDLDGNFDLTVSANASLKITYVGYKTQLVDIKNRNYIVVKLIGNTINMKEMVVVGYGVQKKVNLTGAVSSVDISELKDKPVINVVEALQGTTPGLTIQQSNSAPGARPSINIRGLKTLNNNDPMIIVDGIQSDIQNINMADIENISVLKDASSTAIYGSRASNGVILITTKKGRKGSAEVIYDFNYGVQNPTFLPKIVDSWVYAELRNEALANSGRQIRFSPQEIEDFRKNGPNSNWMKELYKKSAPQQSHSLSIAGGGEQTTYLASVSYLDQESMFKGSDYGLKRFNTRLNVESQVNDRFKLSATMAYTRNEIRDHAYWTPWLVEQATRMPSIYPIKNADGSYNLPGGSNTNALARLEQGGYRKSQNDEMAGTVKGEFKIIEGLKLIGLAGARLDNNRLHENRKAIEGTGDKENRLTESSDRRQELTANIIMSYDKTFHEAHNISAMVGYAYEGGWNNLFSTYRITENADYDAFGENEVKDNVANSGKTREQSIYSGFMRLNYNFKERYLFEFNIRDDVSSKFHKGNRSAIFPSLSAAWRASEESFYGDNLKKIMPSLKLRTSWGLVGNNRIDDYQYQASILSYPSYSFGGKMVNAASLSAGNPTLKWETTRMLNVGADVTFLNNALSLTAEYFNNRTYDILIGLPAPGLMGVAPPIQNAGTIDSKGWELTARYRLETGNVEHTFSANISDSQNKITDLKGSYFINGSDVNTIHKEGYAIDSYYAYRWNGFFQNDQEVANGPKIPGITPKPGDIRYIDKSGDGKITEDEDRFILGNRFPRYSYGFNYQLSWKGLDFGMFWQGVGKRNVWLRGESVEAFHNSNEGPVFDFHIDRWTPSNPDATYPRLTVGAESANNAAKSNFWIQNAAYLRLKNVQMGYTVPESFSRKIYVKNLRVYASVQNALTFTKLKGGWDPETTDGGGRIYPVAQVFSMGVNVKF